MPLTSNLYACVNAWVKETKRQQQQQQKQNQKQQQKQQGTFMSIC